jgi:hypothetical protein
MAEQEEILVVSPGDRKPGPSTPGMERQQAVATDSMWSGVVRTQAGMVSGWHHHGEYETTIYVLTGVLLMEFRPLQVRPPAGSPAEGSPPEGSPAYRPSPAGNSPRDPAGPRPDVTMSTCSYRLWRPTMASPSGCRSGRPGRSPTSGAMGDGLPAVEPGPGQARPGHLPAALLASVCTG